MRTAVIGAGGLSLLSKSPFGLIYRVCRTHLIGCVSGLVCASLLAEKGVAVTVFESARGPGGRMSQRREQTQDGKELCFDHGAPYFTVKDPSVCDFVDKWKAAGLVAEWKGPFGTFDVGSGKLIPQLGNSMKRYVGVPGMNSICKAICRQPGVEAKFGVTVAKLQWKEEVGFWDLRGLQGESIGQFDVVVVSDKNLASPRFTVQTGLPPPLDSAEVPELVEKMRTVLASPCFAVMLAFSQPLASIPVDGFIVTGSKLLSWASCDSRKPGRPNNGSEYWVLHSTAEYADQIISKTSLKKPSDDILNNVKSDLFREFQKTAPDIPAPFFMKAHRWGSAFPTTVIAKDDKCLWVRNKRVAVCGDFCVAPDVEGAILSGLAAASKLLQVHSPL